MTLADFQGLLINPFPYLIPACAGHAYSPLPMSGVAPTRLFALFATHLLGFAAYADTFAIQSIATYRVASPRKTPGAADGCALC